MSPLTDLQTGLSAVVATVTGEFEPDLVWLHGIIVFTRDATANEPLHKAGRASDDVKMQDGWR